MCQLERGKEEEKIINGQYEDCRTPILDTHSQVDSPITRLNARRLAFPRISRSTYSAHARLHKQEMLEI